MLESQEILTQFTISSWPDLKPADRKKIHKELYKKAYPKTFTEPKKATLADVARILSGR